MYRQPNPGRFPPSSKAHPFNIIIGSFTSSGHDKIVMLAHEPCYLVWLFLLLVAANFALFLER